MSRSLIVEIWYERNQRIFHDNKRIWSDIINTAKCNATAWCSLNKDFKDHSIQDLCLNWAVFISQPALKLQLPLQAYKCKIYQLAAFFVRRLQMFLFSNRVYDFVLAFVMIPICKNLFVLAVTLLSFLSFSEFLLLMDASMGYDDGAKWVSM